MSDVYNQLVDSHRQMMSVMAAPVPAPIVDTRANPKPAPPAMQIILSPWNPPRNTRMLDITPDRPVTVGRASKSGVKNLQAACDNALFDCPVVSRAHAEFKLVPSAPSDKQITITDKQSMHGTSVNGMKLKPETPFTLHVGDVIKFGNKVTRGSDTHDGILVSFGCPCPPGPNPSSTVTHTSAGKGYHVPLASDSDDDSDLPDSLLESDPPSSSAKTTPEQPKSKPGSQKDPIILDENHAPPHSSIAVPRSDVASGSQTTHRQPSVVVDAGHRKERKIETVVHDTYDDSSDSESYVDHVIIPSQILNKDDEQAESSASLKNIVSREDNERASTHLDPVHRGPFSSIHESDLSDDYDDDSVDLFMDDGPEDLSSKRRSSPELGGQKDSQPGKAGTEIAETCPKPSQHHSTVSQKMGTDFDASSPSFTAPKPRYDPVRGSNLPIPIPSTSTNPSAATGASKSTWRHTYDSFSNHLREGYANADQLRSSRWDVGPGASSYVLSSAQKSPDSPAMTADNPYKWDFVGADRTVDICDGPSDIDYSTNFNTRQVYRFDADGRITESNDPPPYKQQHKPAAPVRASRTTMRLAQIPTSHSATKTQMSIPNLVDDTVKQIKEATEMAQHVQREARGLLKARLSGGTSKRKADDISRIDSAILGEGKVTISLSSTPHDDANATTPEPVATPAKDERAPKRVKRNDHTRKAQKSSLSWEMTKLGAAAATGGVGLMAFLLSPLADRVLAWTATG